MITYFVLDAPREEKNKEIIQSRALLGTKTVEDQESLIDIGNASIRLLTVRFPDNVLSGATVKNAAGIYYEDTDTHTVFGPSVIYVPITTEWWKTNRVWPGINFDTDHPTKRFAPNTPEEIEEGRWWAASVTGMTWEQLEKKYRAYFFSEEAEPLSRLERESYEAWS